MSVNTPKNWFKPVVWAALVWNLLGVIAFAMHMMMITKNSDGGNNSVVGSITMEKEGQLMRQYGSVHNNSGKVDPYWSQTPFGLEYEAMKKGMVFSARTRMMGNIECNG